LSAAALRPPGERGWHRREGSRLVLQVHVQPGASRTEAAGLHGDCLKIRLSARPVDGEANACLVEFLAGTLGVPRRAVTIETGLSARRKRVCVESPRHGPEVLWDA
jgi:uncharacterized protein (TIGR00251 family)